MFINSDNDRLVTVDWDFPGENKKILNKKQQKRKMIKVVEIEKKDK